MGYYTILFFFLILGIRISLLVFASIVVIIITILNYLFIVKFLVLHLVNWLLGRAAKRFTAYLNPWPDIQDGLLQLQSFALLRVRVIIDPRATTNKTNQE